MENFYRFLENLPSSENIDNLVKSIPHKKKVGKQLGDYFLLNRKLVGEVKFLKKDTKGKIQKVVDELRDREDSPVFYGTIKLPHILKYLKDGDSVNKRIMEKVTSPIEETIRDANRQIRDTKDLFNKPNSLGLVIIVNRSVDILDAELVGWRISNCLRKKNKDGSRRFECINSVLFIDEAHQLKVNKNLRGPVALIFEDPGRRGKQAGKYMEYLQHNWAAWNALPVLEDLPLTMLTEDRLISIKKKNVDKTNMKVHEVWRETYNKSPYLRPLSQDEFLEYGRYIIRSIAPHFLKNGVRSTIEQKTILMEVFTHFLEEVNYRGIDMREFKLSTT